MTKGIDLYTKIILTVIAICLIYIATKDINIVPEAKAAQSGGTMNVNIVGCSSDLPVKISDIEFGILFPLPVKIK